MALRAVRRARGFLPTPRPAVELSPVCLPGGVGNWAPCAVCGSDVTWTMAVAGSDATRVGATHHCRNCGDVVCAFCAPAGDRVGGDRLGEFKRLEDHRVPLPSLGHLEPARVCRTCEFQSYDL